jgi:DNA-binding MarR family transcriptional regulator
MHMADNVTPHLDDLIRELSSEITQIHRWMAEEAGLNTTDLMALYFIRNGEGQVTPKQLSENLGLTSGATTILLNRLEERGLICRAPHPTDRRAVLLSLGEAARAEGIMNLRQHLRAANAEVFDSLSEAEAAIVRAFLTRTLESTRKALHSLRTGATNKEKATR